ncbi:MFS transporter [Limosilactobacillus sp. STM2_1]|uniref:MFS transporter n=1 Tax=Limosilactobacillus rudii TaxID=2759755 RepID=A0A7W3UL27_9LACO|nr:MFS transporter [Limosilactobacillus rudii]MBB1079527.1 MFS transporter [Limosilactobacillus rudii]MBB1097573.1 MFS transporter [Limosilactobacillus rudii]MCD7134682.1 MFS transporter [Limosilactobacillus rudii]
MEYTKKNYKKAPLSSIHLRIYLALILGQIACGFALGISGTALSQATNYISINDFWVGLIGAGSLIGLAGSALMGKLADQFGRRNMLMLDMYLFSVFSLLQLITTNLIVLFILRVLIGLMIAIDYTVGNALLVEWLPAKESGRLQSQLIIYWTIGFIASYITGILITGFGAHNWQIILASSTIPGLIAAVYRSFFRIPASPSWLASQGKNKSAQKLIQKHLGKKWGLSLKQIRSKKPKDVSLKTLFNPPYRRRTIVGGLFYACQAFSFFGISIFLPILLTSMNLGDSNLSGVIYNSCVFIGVLIGSWIFKIISRRIFLIGTFFLSAIALILLMLGNSLSPILQISIFAIFAVILSSGLVLDYPYPTELFDIKVRASGVGTCITISRFGAASGTFLLPVLTNLGGANLAMLVCTIVLLLGGIICLLWAPETSPKFIK